MTEHPTAYLAAHGIPPTRPRPVNVLSHTVEWETWTNACADEAEHNLDCAACEISAVRLVRCPVGRQLHEAQMAAWAAWRTVSSPERQSREGGRRV